MNDFVFPPACIVNGWDVFFGIDRRQVPRLIEAQYWWRRQQEAHAYQSGLAEPDPAEIEAREREEANNPLLAKLPLRPFEMGTLVDVVDGAAVYAVLRGHNEYRNEEPELGYFCFIVVSPRAVERGEALAGEGDCWPVYNCRIRESRLRKEAAKAWKYIAKFARARAAEMLGRENVGQEERHDH